MAESVVLEPVDRVDVTLVMDGSIDILTAPTEFSARPPLGWDFLEADQLIAEHGYALAVTVHHRDGKDRILYDAGLSKGGTIHNLDVLGIDPRDFRAIVLSHGHADHHGGLEGLFDRTRASIPLVLHPDAWRERKIVFPTGSEMRLPPPSHNDLDGVGWQVVEEVGPSLLLEGAVLVTGVVERTTDFERGFPIQHAQTPGGWEPDPWTWDDQAIVLHVAGKGLVILSSCSHAGIVNVLRHARAVTGVDHVHAVIGGLHLSGGLFEGIITPTIDEIAAIAPDVVVPGHCSGWRAIHGVARRLPDAYEPSNVGTTFTFTAA